MHQSIGSGRHERSPPRSSPESTIQVQVDDQKFSALVFQIKLYITISLTVALNGSAK